MYMWIRFFLFTCGFCDSLYRQSNIVLKDNGYSNILLAIHDSVTDETIVDKIKTDFTKASEFLHKATRKRAFFKEIIILVPNTWKDGSGITPATTGQTLQFADIVVSGPRPTHRNYPFTRTYAGCGQSGIHIQMTSDVFLNPSRRPVATYSDKFIVHEWATFRWGVFNEYPNKGENEFYYSTAFGRPDPIRCSIGLLGRMFVRFPNGTSHICNIKGPPDPITGLLEEGCKYYPYPYHNRGTESLMDHQWIKEITDFCDDRHDYAHNHFGHNIEAPNQHNRLCSHRSTWNVIENTDDFRDGKNPPRDISNLAPTFKIVKAARQKRATLYLEDEDLKSSQLADHLIHLIHPSTDVLLRHPDKQTGDHLVKRAVNRRISLLPGNDRHSFASKPFKKNKESEGHRIVISCNSTFDHSLNKGDNIHVLGCNATGVGVDVCNPQDSCFILTGKERTTTALFELSRLLQEYGQEPVHIYYKTLYLKFGKILQDSFCVDEFLDGKMSLRITYNEDPAPQMRIKSPNGKIIKATSVDDKLKIVNLDVESPEKGSWTVTVSSKHSKGQTIGVYIDINNKSSNNTPVTISATTVRRYYQGDHRIIVFAEVSQGHHPVLGLKVIANLRNDSTSILQTDLYDNGSGADIQKDDGIYSRFLPYFNHVDSLAIEVSDPQHNGYIYKTAMIYEDGLEDTNSEHDNTRYEGTKIPLNHGLSRVAMINIPFININTSNNRIPPARIHDLRSMGMDKDRTVTLVFTATGDDLDHGIADHYEILYAHTSQEIYDHRNKMTLLKRVQQTDLVQGETEIFKINTTTMAPNEHSFAFVVQAVDKDGHKGEMSNIVTAGL